MGPDAPRADDRRGAPSAGRPLIDTTILAIDLGTTNAKAAIFRGTRLLNRASRRIETIHPAPDEAEQDPAVWLDAVAAIVREALGVAGVRRLDAIALTAQSDSLVTVGRDGRHLGRCLLWMDQRGTDEAIAFEQQLGRQPIHEHTGLRSAANYTGAKAAWVRRMDPSRFDHANAFLQPKDYLHLWLTDSILTDPSSAGRTLLFDLRTGAWWPSALDAIGLSEARLPRIVPSASAQATLSRRVATHLGLTAGTPVVVGAADRAAEAVGLGLSGPEAMVSSGTATGIARAIGIAERPHDDRITTPAHAMPGEALAMLSIPSTGAAIEWLARVVRAGRGDPVRSILRLAAASAAGAHGVVALPMFAGARSFRWRADARGAFLGLSQGSTAADLARALAEGIAFEIDACIEVLDTALGPIERLRLTGGGYTDPFVVQLLCDVTGRPGLRAAERDAALVGAMLLARTAIGAADDPRADATTRAGRLTTFRPTPGATDAYAPLARRYRQAVEIALSTPDEDA